MTIHKISDNLVAFFFTLQQRRGMLVLKPDATAVPLYKSRSAAAYQYTLRRDLVQYAKIPPNLEYYGGDVWSIDTPDLMVNKTPIFMYLGLAL